VDNLKGKILIVSMIAALAILALSPATHAAAGVIVYGYTDKAYYNPGDTVTLTVFMHEAGTDTIIMINATVVYPWVNSTYPWLSANQTISAKSTAISQGESWNFTATFTIPNDGRANIASSNIVIYYYYKDSGVLSPGSAALSVLHVNAVPFLFSLANMDTVITMIMVSAVLLIISALIIAAAIFLSRRTPKVEWKAEAKE
jgi:hypothetical protein